MTVEVLAAVPGEDPRPALWEELLAARRPLYLAASAALLRRAVRELARQAGGRGSGAREHAFVFHRFLERTFYRAYRDWRAIDGTEQRLVMARIVRTAPLQALAPIAGKPGLVTAALRFVRELKVTGLPLDGWLTRLQPGKEAEFGALAAAYDAYLRRHRLADREDVYRMAAAALAAGGLSAGGPAWGGVTGEAEGAPGGEAGGGVFTGYDLVVIDGFALLTGLERAAIAALAGCAARTVLVVPYDPDRPEVFAETARDLAPGSEALSPAPAPRAAPPRAAPSRPAGLDHLCRRLFHPAPAPCAAGGHVVAVAAPGPAREVQEVARRVKGLLAQGRYLPEDIAVIAPDPELYGPLVRTHFARYAIPVDVLPAPLTNAPVVQAVLGLLRLAQGPRWHRDAVLGLLQSPYLPWQGAGVGALAAALRALPPAAPPQEWLAALPPPLAAPLASLYQHLAGLAAPAPAADHCRAVRALVGTLGIPGRVADLAHGGRPPAPGGLGAAAAARAARELAALGALDRTLARLERAAQDLAGDEPLTAAEFLALLEGELAAQPWQPGAPAAGSRVRFLVPAQAEGLRVPVVFVLGLAEGLFPAPYPHDWVLPEARRRALGLPTWDRHQARARIDFLRAVAAAQERLYLTRPATGDDGEAWLPSPFWLAVAECLADFQEEQVPLSALVPTRPDPVACPADLYLYVAAAARGPGAATARRVHRLAPHALLNPGAWDAAVRRMAVEERRWAPGFSRWDGRVEDPELLAAVAARFGPQEALSATALETYAFCGFRFFGERVLGLHPGEEYEPDVAPDEQGALVHAILARFFQTWGRRPLALPAARDLLHRVVDQAVAEGFQRLPAALREAHRRRLRRWLEAWLEAEADRQAATGAQLLPTYFEVRFGSGTPVELAPGYRFQGVIDRIDTTDTGQFALYDYKAGRAPRMADIDAGLRLQLPIYLAAAARLGLPGVAEPLGAAYYGLRDLARTGIWREEAAQVAGVARPLPADAFLTRLAALQQQVLDLVDRLRAGQFHVHPQRLPCPAHCPLRGACRIDPVWLAAKAGAGAEEAEP